MTNALTPPAGACILKERKGVLIVEETRGMRARERGWDIVMLAILVLFLGLGVWMWSSESTADALTSIICALFAIVFWGYRLIEQQYLDEEGITVRRFGRTVRFLAWRDVGQVHRIRRQKYAVLMVTPAVCPEYSFGDSCDDHVAKCKGQAILLDDSRQNREFIGQVWGKVVVLDFKGQPIEESK